MPKQKKEVPGQYVVQDIPPGREYVSQDELAVLTGISSETWALRRRRGTGPRYAKIGRSIRYPLREVLEWVEARMVPEGRRGRA